MTKAEAIELLGGDASKAARALMVDRKTVYLWPEELSTPQEDRVRGCYARITEERDRKHTVILG